MKTNFVLIDYENVQPATIECLNHEYFKILVFIGAHQAKIAADFANDLQEMGERGKYIQISSNGANALDFHIAFYIGQLAAQEPEAYFHIISKDTGFDPLIQHLKSKKIFANRFQHVTDIPFVQKALAASLSEKAAANADHARKATHVPAAKIKPAASSPDKVALIIADLRKRGTAKPGTVKTLRGTINALFGKKLSEPELSLLVDELRARKFIHVNDTKITYAQPG